MKKGKPAKVNRIQVARILVFVTCSMFMIAYFVPSGAFLATQKDQNDWVAHPMYISPFAGSSSPHGYSPEQMRSAYNLPSSGGANTTIAIVDAFDTPNILDYYNTFSSQYGLPDNSTSNFFVHKMAPNLQVDNGWSLETCLDVEWAHAIAPNAMILLVEATSASNFALLSAVDYAASQPGVVAVSMSWGGNESSFQTFYESHFNKPGITFFASSGDDGSSVMWPASSANVVSVGGTSLYFYPNGSVSSETAWVGSSGGVSHYIARPNYQTNFGLNYPNRVVPDVSYNANPSTGVSVYNGTWWIVGGTSAGAPQWAAIQALGQSATNINLYSKANSSYQTYFRDITQGSNKVNSANQGYDLVTGLGSPLTYRFGTSLDVFPSSGPPNGAIILNGVGFTSGGSVNISYLNPVTNGWTPIINNYNLTSENFTYSMNAPDLAQNNTAGDHQAAFDNIVFRVQDNSNGRTYNTVVPFAEWRRGLSLVGNVTAQGLFGNSTNLATSVFVQNGDALLFSGEWFDPGSVSLLWDNTTNLGIIPTDNNGFFNTTFIVPTTTAGQHTITINDGNSNFCVNLTRLPTVANDYVNGWHASDITINLTPDFAVNETFYSINGGPIFNVTANGEPTITTEGSNNTLEYWCTWNIYGSGLNELPHVTITGIQIDKTPPTGNITTPSVTETPIITLTLSATDATTGIAQMRFSNDNSSWSNWEPYSSSKTWTLQGGDGQKTVFVQFMNNAGLTSTFNYTLTLEALQPTATQTPTSISSPTPTQTPTPSPSPEPTNPTLSPATTISPFSAPSSPPSSPTPTSLPYTNPSAIPENLEAVMILIMLAVLFLVVVLIKKRK